MGDIVEDTNKRIKEMHERNAAVDARIAESNRKATQNAVVVGGLFALGIAWLEKKAAEMEYQRLLKAEAEAEVDETEKEANDARMSAIVEKAFANDPIPPEPKIRTIFGIVWRWVVAAPFIFLILMSIGSVTPQGFLFVLVFSAYPIWIAYRFTRYSVREWNPSESDRKFYGENK